MTLPLARLPYIRQQFLDVNGLPLSDGYLKFFENGTSTPAEVFADAGPNPSSLGVTVTLDASGVAPSIFVATIGYDVEVYDANDVLQTRLSGDQVEDVGSAFLAGLGSYQAEGREVSNGDTVLPTDLLVKFNASSGSGILNLEPVADRTQQLIVMNIGTVDCLVTPDGTDDINFVNAAFTVPAGTTPNWPVAIFLPRQADVSYVLVGGAYLV